MSQLKKNFFYNAILSVTTIVTPLIIFPYVSRILGPQGIGKVNFANSFVQYFLIIASLGIPFYGVREIAKVKDCIDKRTKVFLEIFFVRLLISSFVIAVYLVLILSVEKFHENLLFYLWGVSIIILGVFDLNWFFSGIEEFKYITSRNVACQLLQLILCFLFIKTKDDTLMFFLIPIIVNVLNTLINIKYILKFLKPDLKEFTLSLRPHFKPLLILFSSIFAISVYNLFDTTLLGFISGDISVGYYTVASRINKVPIGLIMVLVPVMIPRVSYAFQNNDMDEVKRLTEGAVNFVIALGVPMLFGILILAPEIITLLAGERFLSAVTATRILCPTTLIIGLTNNFSTQLLIPLGKERLLLFAVLSGTIISLILNITLIPLFQENGAAFSNLSAELAVLIACFYFAGKSIKIEMPYALIIRNILLCFPILVIAWIFRYIFHSSIIILMSVIFCSCLHCFFAQIYILKNSAIRDLANSILKRLKISKFIF